MQYFDLHIHSAFSGGKSSIEQLAVTAKELGYSRICFAEYFQGDEQLRKLSDEIVTISKKVGIDIYLGFEARNPKELYKLVDKRRMFDILLVQGGDLELNRIACETPQVDILTHPENNRFDSGLNHVLAKAAAKNNVAIEINFREILLASKKSRSLVIKNIMQNIDLAKKFRTKIILCSGAISHLELRDPQSMVSMAVEMGLELPKSKDSISKVPSEIINQIKERKTDKWVLPGVKVV